MLVNLRFGLPLAPLRMNIMKTKLIVTAMIVLFASTTRGDTIYDREADVIYARFGGIALTMDVFTPKENANGRGVLWMVSGGWTSSHDGIAPPLIDMFLTPLLERGYTVFAVVHASQPKYTVPEVIQQINMAVRFVRHNAGRFKIDPDKLGISGVSAGGHLSLMQGVLPQPADEKSPDPVARTSSAVQAVAAFVPPTDFLNFGEEGVVALGTGPLAWLRAPFQFVEPVAHPSLGGGQMITFERVTDEQRIRAIGRDISPVYHVDAEDPPILIIHGELDKLVPVQQAELMEAKLVEAGVMNKVVVRAGRDHVWPEMRQDMQVVADWFDEHLGVAAP